MVLAHSLRDARAPHPLAILITPSTLSPATISALGTIYDHLIPVDPLPNQHPANLYLMHRPDLLHTFTKIALWKQTQFRRILYLDADAVCLRAPNELFSMHADVPLAAAPDVGWPDCFNSGVLLLKPELGEYYGLLALAQRGISFDGADQGLLNMHFRDRWARLSFAYNCTPSANYQYLPAYRYFQNSISIAHFIGREKPWTIGRQGNVGSDGAFRELLGRWWAVYDRHYRTPATQWAAGQSREVNRVVPRFVKGEMDWPMDFGYTSVPTMTASEPGREPLADPGDVTPTPTQQRKSSAPFVPPQVEWDPAR